MLSKIWWGVGEGRQIRCIMGNVEVAYINNCINQSCRILYYICILCEGKGDQTAIMFIAIEKAGAGVVVVDG